MSSRATAILILAGLVLAGLVPSATAQPGGNQNGRSEDAPGQQDQGPGRSEDAPGRQGDRGQGSESTQGPGSEHGKNQNEKSPQAPVAPELDVVGEESGNHLYWTEPEVLEVVAYGIYSLQTGGALEPVATVNASQLDYMDSSRSASAWYVVIPFLQDGQGPTSNPDSAKCSWLTLDLPPIFRPECLANIPLGNGLNAIEPPIQSDYRLFNEG